MVMDEARKSFHKDLAEVRQELVRISASIVESIPRGTHVLIEQDLTEAERMIFADDDIDARTVDIESRCIQILALQAPVAGELRQVVSALKICAELERSGDLVVNICKAARRIYGHEFDPRLRGLIVKMSDQARQLFSEATGAYASGDAARAAAIDDMDSFLDDLQRQFIQAIFESHSAGRIDLQVAIQLAVVARFYERIGDHAVNIGEKVRFEVTGWLPEHSGAERFRIRQGLGAQGGES
ncbi:MAG: phosphate signaling complex protein PhoU [Ilumatobacteraceae bacterium]|jgi:phosphate transport system protein